MAVARIRTSDGIVTGSYDDGVVTADGTTYAIGEDADLLAPVEPSTVYCLERNYPAYIEQHDADVEPPAQLMFFLKAAVSVVGPGDPVPYPTVSDAVGYAGELAAVIGRECKHVAPEAVPEVVRGYTIMNDVDAKDQEGVGAMKVFDASAPIGPVVADVDPTDLDMRTTISGEVRQEDNTSSMLIGPHEAVSRLSDRVTLRPGDIVALGSPANPGTVEPGDDVEIWYEGVGTLRNTIAPPE